MSREEQTSKLKKFTISSNESISKKEIFPIKNSQSINTESYEYFNQNTTSNKNITESPFNSLNQYTNSRYSSNNHKTNSKLINQNIMMSGNAHMAQGYTNLSGSSYTYPYNYSSYMKSELEYSSSPKVGDDVICDQCKKELLESGNSLKQSGKNNKYGYQSIHQHKNNASSAITFNNNNSINKSLQNSNNYQKGADASGNLTNSQTLLSKTKVVTYVSPNNPRLTISEERSKTFSSGQKGRRIETNSDSNYCTCSNTNKYNKNVKKNIYKTTKIKNVNMNNEDFCTCSHNNNLNKKDVCTCSHNINGNSYNAKYNYSKRINTNIVNVNNINRSNSYDNIIKHRIIKNTNIIYSQKCVGQKNESLQILASKKPELIAQCVQDMEVIQEPKPIQVILPIQQNEIDYTLGLEIYGQNSEEEKKALKEAEKLRKQMEIAPESIEEMYFNKAYDTIVPHFENLYVDKNEDIFCQNQILVEEDRKRVKIKKQRKPLSVQRSHIKVRYNGLNRVWQPFTIESEEMNICGEKNFDKNNQKVLTTKMLVKGIYKPDWNDLNEAIKTTKMNIDAIEKEPEEEELEEESEPEPQPEPVIEVKKQQPKTKPKPKPKRPKKPKKPKKKPVKKKPVKKIIKKEPEKETDEEITESETPVLDIENFDLSFEETGRQFGPLKVRKMSYNYRGVKKPKPKEKPEKKKYEKNEMIFDSNDALEIDADFNKNLNWGENSFPMTGRPFTIEGKEKPMLYKKNVEKITLKQAYKPKDWNKTIKERNVIKINMPTRKKRQNISKQRIQPIILKGTAKANWNNVIKKEHDSKLEIDKSIKKANFVFSKGNEVYIENDTDEILINDDYNIVEENYARPIRAYIRKVEEPTEESATSDYDILNHIRKHDDQFNQFKELVNESVKMNGQKVVINDISGKYPRRVEIFEGLDEHFEKLANDQKYHKRFNQVVKTNLTTEVSRNIERSGFTKKFDGQRSAGFFTSKRILQRQINDEPIQERVYYLDSKFTPSGGKFDGQRSAGFFTRKNVVQKQINDEPIQERVYYLDSKFSSSGGKQRKITYDSDFDTKLQSKISEMRNKEFNDLRQAYYYKGVTSSGRKYDRQLEEEAEDEDVNYRERELVRNRNQIIINPQNSVKNYFKKQVINEDNNGKIERNEQHIEYTYEGEDNINSPIQQGEVRSQDNQIQGQYYVKEVIQQQQPDGQIKTIQYQYKGQNPPQNYGSPNLRKGERVIQNYESEREEISQSQKQQGQQINIISNRGGSQKLTPKIDASPLTNENDNFNQFREVAFTPKENNNRVKYITLKKRENEDEEEESQPQDINKQIINQETNIESQQQQIKILTQVNEQNEEIRQSEREQEQEKGNEEENQGEEFEHENEEEEEHHHEEYQVGQGEIEGGQYIQQQVVGEEEMQRHVQEQEQNEVQHNENNQQSINNDEEEHRVSAVEEITGQNINIHNLAQTQTNSLNDNKNVLRSKISRTKGLKEDNFNQVDIQSQQQEFNQNQVNNIQNIKKSGSTNREPLSYSFGVKSSTSGQQNNENNEILNSKNTQQSGNSLGPNIMGSKMAINASQFSNGKVINNSRVTAEFGGEVIQNDAQYGRIEMSINQKSISSPSQEKADIKDSNKKEDEEDERDEKDENQ